METTTRSVSRARWAAIGAALAVAVGGGGLLVARAAESGSASTYVGITPCRVVDTRQGADNVGERSTPLGNGETYSTAFVGAVGNCDIPAEAVAVVLNLAIVNPTGNSFLTVFPAGGDLPLAANLNFVAGQAPVSNAATVRIGDDGELSFYNLRGTVDVTADVSGYYLPVAPPPTLPAAVPAPSKTQVIAINPAGLAQTSQMSARNGCYSVSTGSMVSSGKMPLQLPVGASITGMSAVVQEPDFTSTGGWELKILQSVPNISTGMTESSVLSLKGTGVRNGNVFTNATAATPIPVLANATYSLSWFLGFHGSDVCALSISVVLP